ncbi:hypothetical protein [uncultured Jatrophihabitans sp.]|uniref:hypothetical protein n=1 Tax=uncultured Jatrophihabitans sp. TaxID=1610747 RepID=UPI0035C9953E
MTEPTGYSPDQALARDLLVTSLSGASLCWARVHGYIAEGLPEEIRAEGIHIQDRSVWTINLADITDAVTELIEHPDLVAAPGAISDGRTLPYVAASLAAARQQELRRVVDLDTADADYSATESHELIADVVFQLAATGEVVR